MVKQAVSIKVGCKTYNVSNSWNSLFLCGKGELRTLTAFSVFEQLRADKYNDVVEVKLISHAPEKYENGIVGAFDAALIKTYLEDVERRYDLIADSESRNYIQYNQRNCGEKIKLPRNMLKSNALPEIEFLKVNLRAVSYKAHRSVYLIWIQC